MHKRSKVDGYLGKQVVALHEQGMTQSEIVSKVCRSASVISRILTRYKSTGLYMSTKTRGRPRKTSSEQDKKIQRLSNTNRSNATEISHALERDDGITVSSKTVYRRLKKGGGCATGNPLIPKGNKETREQAGGCASVNPLIPKGNKETREQGGGCASVNPLIPKGNKETKLAVTNQQFNGKNSARLASQMAAGAAMGSLGWEALNDSYRGQRRDENEDFPQLNVSSLENPENTLKGWTDGQQVDGDPDSSAHCSTPAEQNMIPKRNEARAESCSSSLARFQPIPDTSLISVLSCNTDFGNYKESCPELGNVVPAESEPSSQNNAGDNLGDERNGQNPNQIISCEGEPLLTSSESGVEGTDTTHHHQENRFENEQQFIEDFVAGNINLKLMMEGIVPDWIDSEDTNPSERNVGNILSVERHEQNPSMNISSEGEPLFTFGESGVEAMDDQQHPVENQQHSHPNKCMLIQSSTTTSPAPQLPSVLLSKAVSDPQHRVVDPEPSTSSGVSHWEVNFRDPELHQPSSSNDRCSRQVQTEVDPSGTGDQRDCSNPSCSKSFLEEKMKLEQARKMISEYEALVKRQIEEIAILKHELERNK